MHFRGSAPPSNERGSSIHKKGSSRSVPKCPRRYSALSMFCSSDTAQCVEGSQGKRVVHYTAAGAEPTPLRPAYKCCHFSVQALKRHAYMPLSEAAPGGDAFLHTLLVKKLLSKSSYHVFRRNLLRSKQSLSLSHPDGRDHLVTLGRGKRSLAKKESLSALPTSRSSPRPACLPLPGSG